MENPLNGYTEAHMLELMEYYSNELKKDQAFIETCDDPLIKNRVLGDIFRGSYELGLLSAGLKNPPEQTKAFWVLSVERAVEMFELNTSEETNTPIVLLEAMNLSIILNRKEDFRILSGSKEYPVLQYESESILVDEIMMGYIISLQQIGLEDDEFALQLAEFNLQKCQIRKQMLAKELAWRTEALIAILRENRNQFQKNFDLIVKRHTAQAQRGTRSDTTEGLVCVDGLALAQLARIRGLSPQILSPYTPIYLLGR